MATGYQLPIYIGLGASLLVATTLLMKNFGKEKRIHRNGLPFKHMVMSHRGGSLENVENTMSAFRHSAKINVDLLELDVQMTRDGQVVIFHDNTLERLCGVQKRVGDLDFKDLPPITIPVHLKDFKHVVDDPDSYKIPLLSTLLKEFPQYPMQIDVKNGSEDLVIKVGRMIKEFSRESVTVWGSFRHTASNHCFNNFKTEIPLFFSISRALQCKLLYHLGLLSLLGLKESCIIMPNFFFFTSKGWIAALKDRGVSVIIFGSDGKGSINSESEWVNALAVGCTGICTDNPSTLQTWLSSRS